MTHVYEVFRRERQGQPFQHAGSVTAPDPRFAEIYAREQYGRRQESIALWLVPRESIDRDRRVSGTSSISSTAASTATRSRSDSEKQGNVP